MKLNQFGFILYVQVFVSRLNGLFQEDQNKRQKLAAIYDDVEKMALEVSKMDDPLPSQIEASMPQYIHNLQTQTNELRKTKYPIVIAGMIWYNLVIV